MGYTKAVLSDKIYNKLKWLIQIVMPAFSSLYFGLSQSLDFLPSAETVIGICALLSTFIGVSLGISTKNYSNVNDGELSITENADGSKVYSLDVKDDPANLANKSSVNFKVIK